MPDNARRNTGLRAAGRPRHRRRREAISIGALLLALVVAGGIWVLSPSPAAWAGTISLLPDRAVPAIETDPDRVPVELGLRFRTSEPAEAVGVQFYKGRDNTGTHTATLWSRSGRPLARVTFAEESSRGLQTAQFDRPVALKPDTPYVVSYTAPRGSYSVDENYFTHKVTNGPLSAGRDAGIYSYRPGTFPTKTYRASNYSIDIVVRPLASSTPPPSATPTARPTPTKTAAPHPAPTHAATWTPTRTPTTAPTSASKTPTSPSTTASASSQTPTSPTSTAPTTPTTPAPPPPASSAGSGWTLSPTSVGLAPFGLRCADLPVLDTSGWRNNTVPAGTTISRRRITGVGTLYLNQGNITISQSCIQPKPGDIGQGSTALQSYGSSGQDLQGPVTIQDSEYDGSLLSTHDQAYVGLLNGVASFYRNYVHDSGSGLNTQGSYEKTGADVVIENNYVHKLIAYGDASGSGNHQSAYTVRDFDTSMRSGRQLIIRGNHFNCDGANATGALFIQPNGGNVTNVVISANMLVGNGFPLILEDDKGRFPGVSYHNMRATDNRIRPTEYGPTKLAGTGEGWTQWQDNHLYDASATDGGGSVISAP